MRLSMTQRNLLLDAAKNARGIVSVTFGYFTGSRHGSYGDRLITAANNLVELGFLKVESSDREIYHKNRNRTTDHSVTKTFSITDEGRKAINKE